MFIAFLVAFLFVVNSPQEGSYLIGVQNCCLVNYGYVGMYTAL